MNISYKMNSKLKINTNTTDLNMAVFWTQKFQSLGLA